MLEVYAETKEHRRKADEYHAQLVEHYKLMDPFREKINIYKNEVDELRDVISIYTDALNKIRTEKEVAKLRDYAAGAKKKLKGKKRMDINELRVLMEQGAVKLK